MTHSRPTPKENQSKGPAPNQIQLKTNINITLIAVLQAHGLITYERTNYNVQQKPAVSNSGKAALKHINLYGSVDGVTVLKSYSSNEPNPSCTPFTAIPAKPNELKRNPQQTQITTSQQKQEINQKKEKEVRTKIHKTTQKTLIKKTSTYNIKETHKTPQIRSRQEITQMK